jgi:hypothetical protein
MTKVEDAAMQLASTFLRANPDATLDEIAEVISQFGGLTGPGELDGDSESNEAKDDSGDDSE